ncbi:MAG: ThiF family adenylyltransferase [Myxococcales bacterium]|nr:ThiF family adenylyltransferase [Myxococcales bacterium]
MALREEQIQRYGRQILLREVGGKGQEQLLHFPVRVEGRSAAVDVAVSVLAASGTPLVCVAPPADGFLAGAVLEAFNPDARAGEPARASLAPAGFGGELLPVAVLVGGQGVAFAGGTTCRDCLDATARSLEGPSNPAEHVLLGSLAALILQRLALGFTPEGQGLSAFRLQAPALAAATPTRCPAHTAGN